MNQEYFHQKIKETLDLCAYEFYVVHPINDIQCTCVTQATQEANPSCKMCLGTGHKIRIKKIKGASNDYIDNVAGRGVRGAMAESTNRTYFVDAKYPISDNDLIIDGKGVYYVFRINEMRGFQGKLSHREAKVLPKKNDSKTVYKNFEGIMKKYKGGKK